MSAFTNKFIYNIYISLYNLFIYKFTNKYIYRERGEECQEMAPPLETIEKNCSLYIDIY